MKIDEFAPRLLFLGHWNESFMEIAKMRVEDDLGKLVKQFSPQDENH
jgi:methylmalonyl-CoA mutase N-terminal domain/subunit